MFICLEGIDGAGKTTQAGLVHDCLTRQGIEVLRTQEPRGTRLGQILYDLMKQEKMTPDAAMLLHLTSRRELINTVIKPALTEGTVVICDRFYLSTLTYQFLRGADVSLVLVDARLGLHPFEVDQFFVLDIPEPLAKERVKERGEDVSDWDSKFYEKLRHHYLYLAECEGNCCVIDATKSKDEITHEILSYILKDNPVINTEIPLKIEIPAQINLES